MVKERAIPWTILLVGVSVMWMFAFLPHTLKAQHIQGDPCSKDNISSCVSPNLTCSDQLTCTCSPNFVQDDNTVCIKKAFYGEACTAGNFNPCYDEDTVCIADVNGTNRCICDNSFYRNMNGTCQSLSQLGVQHLSGSSTTDTVTLTWTSDQHGLNVTYTVKSNQGQGQLQASITKTGATWSNLTPGTLCSFIVTATVPAETFYLMKTVPVDTADIWTVPAKPGQVVSVTYVSGSPGTKYVYNVSFQGSPGSVARYSAVINNEQASGIATSYPFQSLHPGQNYTYNITAFNSINNPSESSVGTFSLNVTFLGEVRNLTVWQDNVTAQQLYISFLCPDDDALARNVQGYRIQKLLLDSNDKQEVNTTYAFVATPTICYTSYSSKDFGGILVERHYRFSVRAWNTFYIGNYSPELSFYVEPRVPRLSEVNKASVLLKKVQDGNLAKTEIGVQLCTSCLLDGSQGKVIDVGLIVCVNGGDNSCLGTEIQDLSQLYTWSYARQQALGVPYLTTPTGWLQDLASKPTDFNYIIGQETDCATLPSTTYCNGPLPVGKDLIIILVQCNRAGCGQVQFDIAGNSEETENTNLGLALGLGIGLGLGCLLLLAVVLAVVCYRRKQTSSPYVIPDTRPTVDYDTSKLPNPKPHRSIKKPHPENDYIIALPDVSDYFTKPDLHSSTHHYSLTDDECIYDYIIDDNMSFKGDQDGKKLGQ